MPSATLLPATPSRHRGRPSVASRQRDRPAALNAATAGVRRLARAQSDHRGVQSLSRRQPLIGTGTGGLRGTPEHRPLPTAPASCLAGRPRGVPRCIPAPSARDPRWSPLRGTSRWGVRWGPDRSRRQTCRRHRREGRSARCGELEKNEPAPRGKQVGRSSTYDRRSDRKCHRISRKSLKVKRQKIFRRGPTFFRRGFDHGENDQSIQAAETCIQKMGARWLLCGGDDVFFLDREEEKKKHENQRESEHVVTPAEQPSPQKMAAPVRRWRRAGAAHGRRHG